MTQTQQRQVIAVSAMIVMAVGTISSVHRGQGLPSSRFLVGFGFVFAITSLLADLGIGLGASLALIAMVGAILENADDVLGWASDRAGTLNPTKKKGK
jgi:hypothetical protein